MFPAPVCVGFGIPALLCTCPLRPSGLIHCNFPQCVLHVDQIYERSVVAPLLFLRLTACFPPLSTLSLHPERNH